MFMINYSGDEVLKNAALLFRYLLSALIDKSKCCYILNTIYTIFHNAV